MSKTKLHVIILAALVCSLPPLTAATEGFIVVVNDGCSVTSVTRTELSRIYLGRTSTLNDGTRAVPVDLSAKSEVRALFSQAVHKRDVPAIKSYWQSMIFSGRGTPPLEQEHQEEVLGFVASTPGAVGYVAADTTLPKGVKLIAVSGL